MEYIVISLVALGILFFGIYWGRLSPRQAAKLVSEGTPLIDVRTRQEFATNPQRGTINVPLHLVDREIANVVSDREQPVLLFCVTGMRSSLAVRRVRNLGYRHVHNIGTVKAAERVLAMANAIVEKSRAQPEMG